MCLGYALTFAYLLNFSSPIAFTCMVRQKNPLQKFSHVRYTPANPFEVWFQWGRNTVFIQIKAGLI